MQQFLSFLLPNTNHSVYGLFSIGRTETFAWFLNGCLPTLYTYNTPPLYIYKSMYNAYLRTTRRQFNILCETIRAKKNLKQRRGRAYDGMGEGGRGRLLVCHVVLYSVTGWCGQEGFRGGGYGSRAFMTRKTKLYKSENALSSPIVVRPPPSKKHARFNVVADERVFLFCFGTHVYINQGLSRSDCAHINVVNGTTVAPVQKIMTKKPNAILFIGFKIDYLNLKRANPSKYKY